MGLVRFLDQRDGERLRADSVCCVPFEGPIAPGESGLMINVLKLPAH